MEPTTKERLIDDILDTLNETYMVNGQQVTGQAISYTRTMIQKKGWRIAASRHDFEIFVTRLGFACSIGRNFRGQKTLVV